MKFIVIIIETICKISIFRSVIRVSYYKILYYINKKLRIVVVKLTRKLLLSNIQIYKQRIYIIVVICI